jgi:hypothetical protein
MPVETGVPAPQPRASRYPMREGGYDRHDCLV